MARAMLEDDLAAAITQAATYAGWRWHHIRRSDLGLQQGHSGFPDLVLAKAGRVLFLELKREGQQPRPDQLAWADALNGVFGQLEEPPARVVTPADLGRLLAELTREL
jgi:hypothetical protein